MIKFECIDAWLITAGTNTGVVKEVGEALNNFRYKNEKHALDVPCIGIGSWGYTAGKEQLTNESDADLSNGNTTKGVRSFMKSTINQTVQAVRMVRGVICLKKYF